MVENFLFFICFFLLGQKQNACACANYSRTAFARSKRERVGTGTTGECFEFFIFFKICTIPHIFIAILVNFQHWMIVKQLDWYFMTPLTMFKSQCRFFMAFIKMVTYILSWVVRATCLQNVSETGDWLEPYGLYGSKNQPFWKQEWFLMIYLQV